MPTLAEIRNQFRDHGNMQRFCDLPTSSRMVPLSRQEIYGNKPTFMGVIMEEATELCGWPREGIHMSEDMDDGYWLHAPDTRPGHVRIREAGEDSYIAVVPRAEPTDA